LKAAASPLNENQRIAALHEYDLLDSLPDKDYDDITRIAADICGMPISLISLIDKDRQWFKSRVGMEAAETPRDIAFCAHAILQPDEIFLVRNTTLDDRFADNPLVTGDLNVNFYAGVPLVTEGGNALGTLCVIDSKPNDLSKEQKETLKALARQVVAYFELRKKSKLLHQQKTQLQQINEDLSRFAYVVAHDIKSPCSSLAMSVVYLKDAYGQLFDAQGLQLLDMMESTSMSAIKMVDGILEHTRVVNSADTDKETFSFGSIYNELSNLLTLPAGFKFEANNTAMELRTSRYALLQVLLNLCTNAIKYNDKENGNILITATQNDSQYKFSVQDNGPGIAPAHQARIFDLFSTLGTTDRFNNKGTGIGLSTVKRLIEKMDGTISIDSQTGKGSTFNFTFSK
jgi:signal transduction histidine kinase